MQSDRVELLRAVPASFECHETNAFALGCKDLFLPTEDAGSASTIYKKNRKTLC